MTSMLAYYKLYCLFHFMSLSVHLMSLPVSLNLLLLISLHVQASSHVVSATIDFTANFPLMSLPVLLMSLPLLLPILLLISLAVPVSSLMSLPVSDLLLLISLDVPSSSLDVSAISLDVSASLTIDFVSNFIWCLCQVHLMSLPVHLMSLSVSL